MSTRAVAERLARRFPISHATIANYEKGKTSPTLAILAALADVYGRPINWFLESGPALTGVHYRSLKSKVRVSDRHWYESTALRWLEAYIKLEDRLKKPLVRRAPQIPIIPNESADGFARRLRKELNLGDNPIPSLIEILEQFAIRVMELPTEMRIDGIAACLGNKHVVMLNPNTSNDRCRLNAAHELIHVLSGDCEEGSESDLDLHEKRAYESASHFILPDSQLKEAFKGQSMVRLVQFKERFGISLAAMIYRAEHSGIIKKPTAKWLWMEFSKRGWRKEEPGRVRPDRAIRFEYLLDSALAEKRLTWREAVTLTGTSEDALRERLELALGVRTEGAEAEEEEDLVIEFPQQGEEKGPGLSRPFDLS